MNLYHFLIIAGLVIITVIVVMLVFPNTIDKPVCTTPRPTDCKIGEVPLCVEDDVWKCVPDPNSKDCNPNKKPDNCAYNNNNASIVNGQEPRCVNGEWVCDVYNFFYGPALGFSSNYVLPGNGGLCNNIGACESMGKDCLFFDSNTGTGIGKYISAIDASDNITTGMNINCEHTYTSKPIFKRLKGVDMTTQFSSDHNISYDNIKNIEKCEEYANQCYNKNKKFDRTSYCAKNSSGVYVSYGGYAYVYDSDLHTCNVFYGTPQHGGTGKYINNIDHENPSTPTCVPPPPPS